MLHLNKNEGSPIFSGILALFLILLVFCGTALLSKCSGQSYKVPYGYQYGMTAALEDYTDQAAVHVLDTLIYEKLLLGLVHNKPSAGWPVKAPYPLPGAILPFRRVIAYYGNFYSKGMGILGELPEQEMLQRLRQEAQHWQIADPAIPVLPAIIILPLRHRISQAKMANIACACLSQK